MNPPKSPKSVEETKQALIDAGRLIFAEQGFDGARVDRIAAKAGVNKALINYHFGGKTELFLAIIEDFTGKLASGLMAVMDDQADAETQLRSFVRFMAAATAKNPEFPRLLLFESLRIQEHLGGPPRHLFFVIQTLAKILEKGQQEGVFKAVNPFFAHFHLMSSFAMYHVTRPLRESLRGKAPIPPEVFSTDAFNQFVEAQIIAGFRSRPGEEN